MAAEHASAGSPEGEASPADSTQPSPWASLPFANPFPVSVGPTGTLLVFVGLALAPVVMAAVYGVLPSFIRRRMEELTGFVMLLAVLGAASFFIFLVVYRAVRQLRQLHLNASLAQKPPKDFVPYLRSFRRTGAVVVRNHLQRLADRSLLGHFWDIELALSLALEAKLPVVAVGAKASSLGSAKFTTNDASWQALVVDLASRARAIVIVPDDRDGTFWELNLLLADRNLRAKTLVVMPPEQFGWRRLLRRLPTIRQSWEATRQRLSGDFELPVYEPDGALLVAPPEQASFVRLPFKDFDSENLQQTLALIVERAPGAGHTALQTAWQSPPEDWRALLDPVWILATVLTALCAEALMSSGYLAGGGATVFMLSLLSAAALSALWYSSAYTGIPAPLDPTDSGATTVLSAPASRRPNFSKRLAPTYWFGLQGIPSVAGSSFDAFVWIALVVLFRAWIFEPFKVPSGSMLPTLQVGDLIVVNKYRYGVTLPFTGIKVIQGSPVRRGDVIVFHYPKDPRIDYIKRVVAVGGDEVAYLAKRLVINGDAVARTPLGDLYDDDTMRYTPAFTESPPGRSYQIIVNDAITEPPYDRPGSTESATAMGDYCRNSLEGIRCRVPPGHYFVMGDNRDNSNDSRYWGFVSDAQVVGKVSVVWMNFSRPARIGTTFD
jgi:signal peptidase I